MGSGRVADFCGRIIDGSISALEVDCHWGYTRCMSPGWYAFVAYAVGGTYTNPSYTGGRGGQSVIRSGLPFPGTRAIRSMIPLRQRIGPGL